VGPWTTTTKTVNRVRTCRSLRERDRHPAPRTPTRAYRSRHWVSQSPWGVQAPRVKRGGQPKSPRRWTRSRTGICSLTYVVVW